jgi:hypothetical protein
MKTKITCLFIALVFTISCNTSNTNSESFTFEFASVIDGIDYTFLVTTNDRETINNVNTELKLPLEERQRHIIGPIRKKKK